MLHTLVSIHYTLYNIIYVWTYTNIHAHIHNTYTDIIYDTYIKYINYVYIIHTFMSLHILSMHTHTCIYYIPVVIKCPKTQLKIYL